MTNPTPNEPLASDTQRKVQIAVQHDGDCSCYSSNCCICDCGALRRSVRRDKSADDCEAWAIHLAALNQLRSEVVPRSELELVRLQALADMSASLEKIWNGENKKAIPPDWLLRAMELREQLSTSQIEAAHNRDIAQRAIAEAEKSSDLLRNSERCYNHVKEQLSTVEREKVKLVELDALYKDFKEVNHQAIWGGSWEREHSAKMQLKPIVNKLFDATIKFLEARSTNHDSLQPKAQNNE